VHQDKSEERNSEVTKETALTTEGVLVQQGLGVV
jgi:hypothetical protein